MKKSLWRHYLHEVIFEAETKKGKIFDIVLFILIILSVLTVVFESVNSIQAAYKHIFLRLEWMFTLLFTIEYFCRIICVKKPLKYIFSFMGIVDLIAILPSYVGLIFSSHSSFLTVRAIRLLRVFRIFKISRYIVEEKILIKALAASRIKITIFLIAILSLVLTMGTIMYFIEGESPGFQDIPQSIYWAIVTITTVGYGDITPNTAVGQLFASIFMILGYAIIAVPTGIVSAEIVSAKRDTTTIVCESCCHEDHDQDAIHCNQCGSKLNSWIE